MSSQTEHADHGRSATAGVAGEPDDLPLTVIEPESGWQAARWTELWRYRELLYFLAWRDVKVRYKQTFLGAAWAMLQPTLMMVVFTLVLHRLAHVPSGDVPYPLFVYAGLVAWSFFATAVAGAAQSVVNAERLITKVYFPRLAVPLGAIAAALVDFLLACLVLLALMSYYRQPAGWGLLATPAAVLLLLLAALAFGAALAALNVAYRDVRHALPFLLQLWLFATPSVYLNDATPVRFNWLALNPLDGLIAFFRSAVLDLPLPWGRLACPAIVIPIALVAGCLYFRRVEDSFADII